MEESKVLFKVTSEFEGTSVRCECDNEEEQFQVAMAIHDILRTNKMIALMLVLIGRQYAEDMDFRKAKDDATVDFKQFEQILKNTK